MQHCSYGVLTPELFNLACRNRDAHLPSQMQYAVNLLRWLRNLKKQNGMLPTRKEGCHWMLNFSECHEHLHYCCSHSAVNSVDVSEASWSDPNNWARWSSYITEHSYEIRSGLSSLAIPPWTCLVSKSGLTHWFQRLGFYLDTGVLVSVNV